MKKFFVLVTVLAVTAVLCLTTFADPGAFLSSPSGNPAPELVDFSHDDHDCPANLKITAYKNRDTLSDSALSAIESAYNQIASTEDLADIYPEFKNIADELGILSTDLVVSDLFDISYIDCDIHNLHDGKFRIKLSAETLDNFVGLLYFDGENWSLIESATVSDDGEYLEFSTELLGSFAIVVDTSDDGPDIPVTGDTFRTIMLVMMISSAVGLIVIAFTRRRVDNKA